jgi:hypothetical protein
MADPNREPVVVPIRDGVGGPTGMAASIFISYASKDRAAAHTICDRAKTDERRSRIWRTDLKLPRNLSRPSSEQQFDLGEDECSGPEASRECPRDRLVRRH